MARTLTKLFPEGILQSSAEFDEVNFSGTIKVGPDGVFAKEFNELDLVSTGYASTILSTYVDNNNATDAAIDSLGNTYYVGAVTVASNGSYGLLLTKYNPSGVIQWQRQLIGPSQQTLGNAIAISPAGDIYVVGYAVGGDGGAILVKYTTSGAIQWQRAFSGAGGNAYGNGITVDSSNNIYIAIQYYISGQAIGVINKYDSSGTLQWKKQLGFGYFDDIYLQDIVSDLSGNTYVVGTVNLAGSYKAVQLAKYDTDGSLQWQQQLFTNFTRSNGSGISLDSTGNIYVCGSTDENNDAYKSAILIAKLNSLGVVQWTKRLTSGPSSASTLIASGADIVIDSSNNIYICGTEQTSPTALRYVVIAKYNTSGALQWQRTITGSADIKARGINLDSQGKFYVTGSIAPGASQSNGGSWLLAKLPSDGSLTGSYIINGVSVSYAPSTLNSHAGSLSSSASSLNDSTNTGTSSISTLTESISTYSSSVPTVIGIPPAERRLSDGTYLVSGYFDDHSLSIRAPDAPIIESVTVLSAFSVSVAFSAPEDPGSSPISSFMAISNPDSITGTAPDSPIIVSGLTAARSYTFSVSASSEDGTSELSIPSTPVTTAGIPPSAPTVGTATVLGTSSVSVTFTAPVNPGTSPITSYVATSVPGGITGTSASSPITVSGLSAGTNYRFTVAAVSAAGTGTSSSQSNQVTTTAPTGQAIFTTATAGGSNYTTGPVGFTWVCPAGVTSVSVVAVGAGGPSYGPQGPHQGWMAGGGGALAYANNISVTPGATYYLSVGYSFGATQSNHRTSKFGAGICEAQGGGSSLDSSGNNYAGGVIYGTGGRGGPGGNGTSGGGGGGAGGYAGGNDTGGGFGFSNRGSNQTSATSGTGGAGGGGNARQDGGGVGIFGQGSNGGAGGGAGSGGTNGGYGAGAGALGSTAPVGSQRSGGGGVVRIVWPGTTRQFPSTNVGNF